MTETIAVLGSTGSVGLNTLDVAKRNPGDFRITGLSGNTNHEAMLEQVVRFQPQRVVMADSFAAEKLQAEVDKRKMGLEVQTGHSALESLAADTADTVVCGIVGSVGLASTLAAVDAGKKVLIANKEPLVMLGDVIVERAKRKGAVILPLDSEHNAIFQCLPQIEVEKQRGFSSITPSMGIKKILLTGSGGPLRNKSLDEMRRITPSEACNHPNWNMGPKISVDSATLMNKGLELIEACALFGVEPGQVEIVIHPQSFIHSMVEYVDGSIIAQLGAPDMRVPIANALAWPRRIASGADSLDFAAISRFDFESPDPERFPALRLAREAANIGGTLPTIMSGANEVAVASFLDHQIGFSQIIEVVEKVMNETGVEQEASLESVLQADNLARQRARSLISKMA